MTEMIRREIQELMALGPLPRNDAEGLVIEKYEDLLSRVVSPLSLEEARSLLDYFGPDDCFGLAWTLLHLIESAPQTVVVSQPPAGSNMWMELIWKRAH